MSPTIAKKMSLVAHVGSFFDQNLAKQPFCFGFEFDMEPFSVLSSVAESESVALQHGCVMGWRNLKLRRRRGLELHADPNPADVPKSAQLVSGECGE